MCTSRIESKLNDQNNEQQQWMRIVGPSHMMQNPRLLIQPLHSTSKQPVNNNNRKKLLQQKNDISPTEQMKL